MTINQQHLDEARGERLSAIVPLGVGESGNVDCESAIQGAFQMGKAARSAAEHQYREFVLFGWPSQKRSSQEVSKPVNNLHLNGGGLAKLKADAIDLALAECNGNGAAAARKLKVSHTMVYDHLSRRRMVAALILCLCSTVCFAQRGTNIKPEPTVGTLALPVPVFRQTVLRWDNPAGASNVVSWGLARNAWTNGVQVINTNAFFVTNNWHYRVTAMVAGIESVPALWPSNRVGQLWLVGMSNDMKQRTNLVALTGEFDDVPPGNMQLWGVENRTLRFK